MKYSELSQAIETAKNGENFVSDSNLNGIDFAFRLKITRPRTPLKLAQIYHDVSFKLFLMDKYGGNVRTLQRLITIKLSLELYLNNCIIYHSNVNHEVYNEG